MRTAQGGPAGPRNLESRRPQGDKQGVCLSNSEARRRGDCDVQVHQGRRALEFLVSCLLRAALSQGYARRRCQQPVDR